MIKCVNQKHQNIYWKESFADRYQSQEIAFLYFEFVKLCDYNIMLKKQPVQLGNLLERFSIVLPLVNPFS